MGHYQYCIERAAEALDRAERAFFNEERSIRLMEIARCWLDLAGRHTGGLRSAVGQHAGRSVEGKPTIGQPLQDAPVSHALARASSPRLN